MFFLMIPRPPTSTRTDTPFPYPTRFRSTELDDRRTAAADAVRVHEHLRQYGRLLHRPADRHRRSPARDRPASCRTRSRAGTAAIADTDTSPCPARLRRGRRVAVGGATSARRVAEGCCDVLDQPLVLLRCPLRTEERRVGKACVSTCKIR